MVVAIISVYQCEDCPRVAVLRHDIEYDTFEATWFNGLRYQFCPVCREKPQAEDRIEEDLAARAAARVVVSAVRGGVEYVS